MAVGLLIAQSIGHEQAKANGRYLTVVCSYLGYDQTQVDAMPAEAAEAYQADRGRALIERAFAEEPPR